MIGEYHYYAVTHSAGEEKFFSLDQAVDLYSSLLKEGFKVKLEKVDGYCPSKRKLLINN